MNVRSTLRHVFFSVSTGVLALLLFAVVLVASLIGAKIGQALRSRTEGLHQPASVMQAAMLSFMALVLAFGLTLAVGRYETRRTDAVDEANAIGTTYLRAQTLAEPVRTQSLNLLVRFAKTSDEISHAVPNSATQQREVTASRHIERRLWHVADQALLAAPEASAPRLYVESLNEMFDAQTTRVAGLGNRVPTTVMLLELVGSALAIGILSLHLALLGRGSSAGLVAAGLVGLILLVSYDLDRPVRGFIEVPSTALDHLRTSLQLGPSAEGPGGP